MWLAFPAHAQDNKLNLSATATFTTDYVFRGISQTQEIPAVQGEFDATYGIFYPGIWSSSVDFGGNGSANSLWSKSTTTPASRRRGRVSASISPVSTTPIRAPMTGNSTYFELKTAASYTIFSR